jgi:hypothetical protein
MINGFGSNVQIPGPTKYAQPSLSLRGAVKDSAPRASNTVNDSFQGLRLLFLCNPLFFELNQLHLQKKEEGDEKVLA